MKYLAILVGSVLGLASLAAQTTSLDCGPRLPSEKVVVYTDREVYGVGEQLWFSATCLQAGRETGELSKVLYVEVYDAQRRPFAQQKFRLENGRAEGALTLPVEMPTGYYFLRAYTHYLRNFPPSHYHNQVIAVVNPAAAPAEVERESGAPFELIWPQGDPVAGLPTELLVKTQLPLEGQTGELSLRDADGRTVAQARWLTPHWASLTFTPASAEAYQLLWTGPSGQTHKETLPAVRASGLRVDPRQSGDQWTLDLQLTAAFLQASSRSLLVQVLGEDQQVVYQKPFSLSALRHQLSISTQGLPSGVLYLAVRDERGDLLQLHALLRPSDVQPLSVVTDKPLYDRREAVTATAADTPESLVVSVRRLVGEGRPQDLPPFLLNNPWLLPAYANNHPEWRADGPEGQLALALLADYVREKELPSAKSDGSLHYLPEPWDMTISGLVREKTTRAPLPKVMTMVAVLEQGQQLHQSATHADGGFAFPLTNVSGDVTVYLGLRDGRRLNAELLVNSDFSTAFPSITPPILSYDIGLHRLLEEIYLGEQLQRSFPPLPASQAYAATTISALPFNLDAPDQRIVLADYIQVPTMQEVFTELVPHVNITGKPGERQLVVWDENAQQRYDAPIVLLDRVPIYDIDALLVLDPLKIDRIETINGNYLLGDYLFGGVIAITTKTNDFAGYAWPPESVFVRYKALSQSPAFAAPTYETTDSRNRRLPDFRTTLYWHPHWPAGRRPLQFFTGDRTGEYELLLRGRSTDGRAYLGRAVFSVEKAQQP